jgi:hypothetical protein
MCDGAAIGSAGQPQRRADAPLRISNSGWSLNMTTRDKLDKTLSRWRRMRHNENWQLWADSLSGAQRRLLNLIYDGMKAAQLSMSMVDIKAAVDAVGADERAQNETRRRLQDLCKFRTVSPDRSP